MRPTVIPAVMLATALQVLSGCALDPYTRDGVWRPTAANERNLRAMIADPRDLQQGVGEPGSNGERAAAAVRRLMEDNVRPLPTISSGSIGGGSSGSASN